MTYPIGAITNIQAINNLLEIVPGSEFVDSVRDWWDEHGFITAKQNSILNAMAQEATKTRKHGPGIIYFQDLEGADDY